MTDEFDESKKGLSIAALVLGIVGILISCTPVGIVASILGLIFGGLCLYKKQGIKGMAITGLVLGIISLALWIILIIAGVGIATIAAGMFS